MILPSCGRVEAPIRHRRPADLAGRRALRVEPTDTVPFDGKPGVNYVDMPIFVIIPAGFKNGAIEVDILSRLNG